jgi:hypothetical protein
LESPTTQSQVAALGVSQSDLSNLLTSESAAALKGAVQTVVPRIPAPKHMNVSDSLEHVAYAGVVSVFASVWGRLRWRMRALGKLSGEKAKKFVAKTKTGRYFL